MCNEMRPLHHSLCIINMDNFGSLPEGAYGRIVQLSFSFLEICIGWTSDRQTWIARHTFSTGAYLPSIGESVFDAKATGWPFWIRIAPSPFLACITLKGDFCIAVIHVVLKVNYITPLVCEMLEEYKRKKRGVGLKKKMLKRANLPKKMHKYIHVGKCNRRSLVALNISNVIGLAC